MDAEVYARHCTLGAQGNYVWPHGDAACLFNPRAPVYRHVVGPVIQYWLFYSFNKAGYGLGDHEADWEYVRVNHDARTMAMSQHDGDDVVQWESVPPKIYVALGSHAMYSSPGRKWRYCGFGNDVRGNGIEWTPTTIVDLKDDEPHPVLLHKGDWGQRGVSALTVRPYWLG